MNLKIARHTLFTTLVMALSLFASGSLGAQEAAASAVEIEAEVTLIAADSSQTALVERRLWQVPLGRRFSAFLANFSLELTVNAVDSQRVDVNTFLATVGSRPDSRTKRFLMELELPAVIDNIRGKAGSTYKLRLIPRAFTDIDLSACEYDHRDSGSFKKDPTAYFDLYYVPQSLGDYHWNKVKQLLEGDFRPFREAFDITMPGKIHYFMHPCPTPTIAWDSRFGYYIDPTRMQAHVVYNHDYMGATVLVANLTQLLRVSGYAPPFLAEGLASYFYFNDYETLLANEQGTLIPLAELLTTWGYYSADPTLAAAQAGSFCRFLADTRGIERFRALYKESDDLTIAGKFIEHYGAPITALESAWLAHLDTLQPTRKQFLKRSGIEAALGSPRRALDVLETALQWDGTISDTLNTMENMAPYYAELGRYDLALRTYQALYDAAPETSTKRSRYLLRVGYYNMLTGELERARENFTALAAMDTTQAPVARFNLARTALLAGDTTGALADLEQMRTERIEPLLQAEVTLTLAYIYAQPGPFANPDTAAVRFRQAYSAANYLVTNAPTQPLHRLRHGLAALGLGRHDFARQNLDVALFLEFRPQYVSRELVALGNLEDLLGNREQALAYYHQADSVDQSFAGQQRVARYLKEPFALKVSELKAPDSTEN